MSDNNERSLKNHRLGITFKPVLYMLQDSTVQNEISHLNKMVKRNLANATHADLMAYTNSLAKQIEEFLSTEFPNLRSVSVEDETEEEEVVCSPEEETDLGSLIEYLNEIKRPTTPPGPANGS